MMDLFRPFTLCVLSCFSMLHAWTQVQGTFRFAPVPHVSLLPEVSNLTLLQDREGYLWYGMNHGGLCRDNGYQMDEFRNDRHHPDLLGRSNTIWSLAEDSLGNIIIGTKAGCYLLDKVTYQIAPLDTVLRNGTIRNICTRRDGTIWLTSCGKVYSYDTQYRPLHSYSVENIQGQVSSDVYVFEDSHRQLWALLNPMGLARFHTASQCFVPCVWDYPYPPSCIVEDPVHHNLWIGTYGGGVVKYEEMEVKGGTHITPIDIATFPNSEQRTHTVFLTVDTLRGYLWQVTTNNIFAYDIACSTPTPITLGYEGEDSYKIVNCVLLDRNNDVWVGGNNPQSFNLLQSKSEMQHYDMSDIRERTGIPIITQRVVNEGNARWVYNDRIGLCHINAQGYVTYARDLPYSPLGNLKPTYIPCHQNGGIWAHSNSRLFHIWMADSAMQYEIVATNDNRINCIADDGQGRIYMGDALGVCYYDSCSRGITRVSSNEGGVHCMVLDKQGTLFYSTAKVGLRCYTRNGKQATLLQSGSYSAMTMGKDDYLWLGTALGEVYLYKVKTGQCERDEMASNSSADAILSMTGDEEGCLCILSHREVKLYHTDRQETVLLGRQRQRMGLNYFISSYYDEGQYVVTGSGGYACFASSILMKGKSDSPAPIITGYKLDGTKFYMPKGCTDIEVEADVQTVTLYFSTFDMLHADDVVFAYRINNDSWSTLSPGCNEVVLQNPRKGFYTIEIKATNAAGVMIRKVGVYHLHCLPAWWDTWWAYVLYALAFSAIVSRVIYNQHQKAQMNLQIRNLMDMLDEARRNSAMQPVGTSKTHLPVEEVSVAERKQDILFLQKAMKLVEDNMDNTEYDVELFSSDLCMSRATLYRRMISVTGQKPTEFIRIMRLKEAARLLKEGDMSVSEVVDRVGFSSTSYFNKRFKELFGVQPSQYK